MSGTDVSYGEWCNLPTRALRIVRYQQSVWRHVRYCLRAMSGTAYACSMHSPLRTTCAVLSAYADKASRAISAYTHATRTPALT
eukprot:3940643-Rhodomonas_salina.12